jgi:ornithine--oxo-acid transaminase
MNILFIADEVRQGAGKTGMFFSFQHLGDDVKPDTVIMGKSITGGFYPQSFIMGVDTVMASVGPYEIASTYSFTPLAIAAANATIDVIDRENLIQRGVHIGDLWRKTVESWNHPLVDYVAQVGADSNLILREVEPSRVASLVYASRAIRISQGKRHTTQFRYELARSAVVGRISYFEKLSG